VIRILLVDDQTLLRQGLAIILNSEEDLTVVGEAADGREAVDLALALEPDVVLMDVQMPVMDGVEACSRIHGFLPRCRVIILTTFDFEPYVRDSLRSGAAGYLLKDTPAGEMVRAIRGVCRGEALLQSVSAADILSNLVRGQEYETGGGLTERETEVVRLVARGLKNEEIARELYIGEGTVKTHLRNIFGKLGLEDRSQVVISAYEKGLVRPGRNGKR